MSTCTLANGCTGCKRSIEENLKWYLLNKPDEFKHNKKQKAILETARLHGSPELKALIIEKGL